MLFVLQLKNKHEMAKLKFKLNHDICYNYASWSLEVKDHQIEYELRTIINKYLINKKLDSKDKKLLIKYLIYSEVTDKQFNHCFSFNSKEENLLANIIMEAGLSLIVKGINDKYSGISTECIGDNNKRIVKSRII